MIEELHFLRPWWLMTLLLPFAVVWFASQATDIRARWKNIISPHLLDSLIVEPTAASRVRAYWLLAGVLLLAALAASGPAWQREAPPFVEDTAPLVIAVDLSATMDATDVTPSRLERAKLKIKDIVARRDGAKTALVAYAGSAHQVLPLTDDASLLDTYADALSTRIMPVPGKNTAAGLEIATKALADSGSAGTVLFLTDGLDEASIPAFTKKSDIGILVLGVGTAQSGSAGNAVDSQFDVDALRKFGAETSIDVATITDGDTDVRWVVQHVATNYAAKKADDGNRWKDAGYFVLFPAAMLFAFTFRRGWVVRVGVLLLAARLILVPSSATAADLADMWLTPDQQGRIAYDRGDFTSAAAHFQDPMWRGTALFRAEKYADAAAAFASVDTPEAFYNQGNALLHLGKFEEAVTVYRKALETRKNWTDAQSNLATAERLLAAAKKDDDDQPQDPNEKPDDIKFDDKGKKGKAGQVNIAEQTSEMWMKNIQVSPADLMARKFAIEAGEQK
jgi:Ca-activated chloride channel family protein